MTKECSWQQGFTWEISDRVYAHGSAALNSFMRVQTFFGTVHSVRFDATENCLLRKALGSGCNHRLQWDSCRFIQQYCAHLAAQPELLFIQDPAGDYKSQRCDMLRLLFISTFPTVKSFQ